MDNSELYLDMSSETTEDLIPVNKIFDLTGKVAVVTGSTGLAYNVIYRLGECGAKVVFGSRKENIGLEVEQEMRDHGFDVTYKQTDVTKIEDCRAIIETAEKVYGTVEIAIPIAAYFLARAFVDVKEEEYDRILDINLKGQYFVLQAAARSMIKGKKGGKIVTISSVAWRGDDMPYLGMNTPYNASKAGVTGMTRGIARELKQYGINTNCIAPGGMITPGAIFNNASAVELYGKDWNAKVEKYGGTVPVTSNPDDVARMIVAMCTSISDYMYGQIIEVDGGSQYTFQDEPWGYTMEGGKHA